MIFKINSIMLKSTMKILPLVLEGVGFFLSRVLALKLLSPPPTFLLVCLA